MRWDTKSECVNNRLFLHGQECSLTDHYRHVVEKVVKTGCPYVVSDKP